MIDLLPHPDLVLTLVALGFAAGVDLFWVVFLLAVAARVSWLAPAPGDLVEMGTVPILLFSAVLHTAERCAEALPSVALFWHSAQAVARPIAGALLAAAIVPGGVVQATGAAAAGAVLAATGHRVVWGLDLRRWLDGGRSPGPVLAGLAEDVVVAGLVVLVLERPEAGGVLVVLVLGALLLRGRFLLDLSRFGLHLVWGSVQRLTGRWGWRRQDELPAWVRDALERERRPGNRDRAPLRGLPVGVTGSPGHHGFRWGWLAGAPDRTFLVLRERGRARALPVLPGGAPGRSDLFDRLPARAGEAECELLVARDGPDVDALAAELASRGRVGA
ncbi:MAG: DUF4126 family protein [Gemmatimonadetes bacterium]|nr:DUF4126 family protein [Gemmatimonadota bacterium]NIT90177.1 DUF4126 family protein [Gemmatimonadota bacterium]NIU38169.1 DUF4126 family protein [Gemmatimonadota bacterium]NIV64326.1 DUF4126 family protein [Gemmatimonadota bacterium]NIV85114.1 DUF4126 family protein [Gemmatimonadota bacterium]